MEADIKRALGNWAEDEMGVEWREWDYEWSEEVGKKEKRKVKHEMAGMLSVKQKPKDRQEESH